MRMSMCVAMFAIVRSVRLRFPLSHVATLALTMGIAGCSGESARFKENPFASNNSPEATGSIQPAPVAPVSQVESRPLPPQAQLPPSRSDAIGAVHSSGVVGGGRGLASYTPDTSPANPSSVRSATSSASEVTGAIPPPKAAGANKWRWDGGTAITVVPGDTIDSISRRYGVPGNAIIQANNLSAPATLRAGQQLVIPRYQATRAPASQPKVSTVAATNSPVTGTPAGVPGVHVVAPGETLSKISRLYGKSVSELARANNLPASARLTVGAHLVIPGVRTSATKPNAAPAVAETTPAPQIADATANASVFAPALATPPVAGETSSGTEGAASLPKFRWPANGRVITAFGPTTNGQQNDGINIAVPENTPVKAAEDGVVAYAGNELKGYGNLVLVRHPNGYVTAYAHAKELLVKRGDQIKRGQVIARSGQSGNVNAPQLHFEIRKGSSPVDPTKFLSGA